MLLADLGLLNVRLSPELWRRELSLEGCRPVHDDLVRRDFTAEAPYQLWLTDITEHHTDEGKLYLCAIKDVYLNSSAWRS